MMLTKCCPKCKKSIPTSWYLGAWDSYRCVNCASLLRKSKTLLIIPNLALIVFALLLFFLKNDLALKLPLLLLSIFALNPLVSYLTPVKYAVNLAQDNTRAVLEALDLHGDGGCGVISLSLETSLSQDAIREVFRKHKRYFIPVKGTSTFALNKLTVENGSIDKILLSIEQKKTENRVVYALGTGIVVGIFIGFFPF